MTDLRCHACKDGADHFDHDLRERVAEAIRRFPNAESAWWIGPEAVLARVEEHLRKGSR